MQVQQLLIGQSCAGVAVSYSSSLFLSSADLPLPVLASTEGDCEEEKEREREGEREEGREERKERWREVWKKMKVLCST